MLGLGHEQSAGQRGRETCEHITSVLFHMSVTVVTSIDLLIVRANSKIIATRSISKSLQINSFSFDCAICQLQ